MSKCKFYNPTWELCCLDGKECDKVIKCRNKGVELNE